jgi:hypothetical protein
MSYIKIKEDNIEELLANNNIAFHCAKLSNENELETIDSDFLVSVDRQPNNDGFFVRNPFHQDPDKRRLTRYESNFFTTGYWWIKI